MFVKVRERAVGPGGLPESTEEWQKEAATRLLRASDFMLTLRFTVYLIIGVMVNECPQAFLFRIFKTESRAHPEMSKFAARFNYGVDVPIAGGKDGGEAADPDDGAQVPAALLQRRVVRR